MYSVGLMSVHEKVLSLGWLSVCVCVCVGGGGGGGGEFYL